MKHADINSNGLWLKLLVVLGIAAMIVLGMIGATFHTQQDEVQEFTNQLLQTAGEAGEIGAATDQVVQAFQERTGWEPQIVWSSAGELPYNEAVTVKVYCESSETWLGGQKVFPIGFYAEAEGKLDLSVQQMERL